MRSSVRDINMVNTYVKLPDRPTEYERWFADTALT